MALRELVTGAGGCSVPGEGASSSSNPLASFAGTLLGTLPKSQERIRELPSLPTFQEARQDSNGPIVSLPGSEHEQESKPSEFLRGFREADQRGYAHVWNEATQADLQRADEMVRFSEFERIYGQTSGTEPQVHYMDGPPQKALAGFLRSFFLSTREEVPFPAVPLPELGLSTFDKQRIRDRSSIMARHFFAEKGEEYCNAQVRALLQSLNIEDGVMVRDPFGRNMSELEQYYEDSKGYSRPHPNGWVEEFQGSQNGWVKEFQGRHNWVNEFQGRHDWVNEFQGRNDWATEFQSQNDWAAQFAEEQQSMHAKKDFRNLGTIEQTRSLVDTLSQNKDPKFQNSKFLHFVSRMSRGELIVEDNQVKENTGSTWATEFGQTQPQNWAAEFTAGEPAQNWAEEFAQEQGKVWAEEYSGEQGKAWAEEYSGQQSQWADEYQEREGWLESYDKFVEEQLKGEQHIPQSSKWSYVFAEQNPYVGHPNPLKEGQDLFRKGLLSEAVLALEAEVLKNPDNAEGWRLLGITHAENDDDRQAIASMVRARDADSTNLEVLLALGVSHTNEALEVIDISMKYTYVIPELEQAEALMYLRGWLQHHPKYGKLVPQENAERLTQSDVARLFKEAAAMAPEDGDIHTVLGVLYNLSREYSNAIQAFETALKLKPRDYSLWNKLGATQANSARSSDAIHAYQQALNLKPNYVRAWSIWGLVMQIRGAMRNRFDIMCGALCMNPKADNAWQYLRMSLSATRTDLLDACDKHDLDRLQAEFPL